MQPKIYFAGDHNSGLAPQVLDALHTVNSGKVSSYRDDDETKKMQENFNDIFGQKVKALSFVTGTAANVCAITAVSQPFQSVVCSKTGHIHVHEAGGPTRISGCSLDVLPTKDGKITPAQIQELLDSRPPINIFTQPKIVYITQPTEMGILWSLKELQDLSSYCKSKGLLLIMDGARIGNALDQTKVSLKEMTVDIGVDILLWGGIKNGGLCDVLIVFNPSLTPHIDFIYKQMGQEVAKSRFYSATVNALLENDLWLKNASHANAMTQTLYQHIKLASKIKCVLPVETNFIWSVLDKNHQELLSQRFEYYLESNELERDHPEQDRTLARWVTSWATTQEEVHLFAQAILSL